jgi:EmrB/QacA subfamily drug resistance transporter
MKIEQKWLVMISVAMGVFLGTIDGSIVNVALPTLVTQLDTNFQIIQWVVLAYMLTQAVLLIIMGRLADIQGKKRIYQTGMLIFTISSALCGISPSVEFLIFSRIIQAIGASMTAGLGMAIVTENFPDEERGKALGIMGTIVTIGIVFGPAIGGLILSSFAWRWIFYVNVPIGIFGFFMVRANVPHKSNPSEQKFDFLGAVLLLVTLLSLLIGLTLGQTNGFINFPVLALFAVSLMGLIAFLITEKKVESPMIDLSLFSNKLFTINLVSGTLVFLGLSSIAILMPFYLENILGFNTRTVGLLMASNFILLGIFAPIAGNLSDRFRPRAITVIGLSILTLSFIFMSTISATTNIFNYLLRVMPIGIGLGIFQSPNNSAILGSVPKDKLGVTSSMLSLSRVLGNTIGISLSATLWTTLTLKFTADPQLINANIAPVAAQIQGYHITYLLVAALMLFNFVISFRNWRNEKRATTSA